MNANALNPMWESLVLRGMAGILFGLAAVFWPALTVVILVYIFSIYVLVNGMIDMVQSIMNMFSSKPWLLTMLLGVGGVGVGLFLIRRPEISIATFVLIIGLALIVRGVFEFVIALTEQPSATYKTLMIIGSALSVIVGVAILLHPLEGGLAFVWLLGLYALITGPIWIALGVDAKKVLEAPTARRKK